MTFMDEVIMPPASPTPTERARKMHSSLLQRLAGTQEVIAAAIGVSGSTVSRAKENFELVTQIIAHSGLKLVDEGHTCVPATEIAFLRKVYARVCDEAPWLVNEGDA